MNKSTQNLVIKFFLDEYFLYHVGMQQRDGTGVLSLLATQKANPKSIKR